MRFSRFLMVIAAFYALTGITACGANPNVPTAFAKSTNMMRKDSLIKDIATSYDGKNLIKFRMVVDRKITQSEANKLIQDYFSDVRSFVSNNAEDSSALLKPYSISFEIIDQKNAILFKGIKDSDSTNINWS